MSTRLDRPAVVVVMAMTADGKISSSQRESVRLAGPRDRDLLDRLRAESDAVLHGAGTIRADDPPMRIRSQERIRERERAGRPPHPLQIVVSRTLDLPFDGRFFNEAGIERIVLAPSSAPEERAQEARSRAEIVRLGVDRISAADLLGFSWGRGVRRLLCEGGGELNFDLFAAGAVDEVYVTVAPWILGGRRAPTPVDGDGLVWNDRVALELLTVERENGEIYLHYRVSGRAL
jgi:2,5-diamino-6-(ribosylamino)-4(3H)-pyrimidinone 5'-phosphate reductase